MIDHWYYLHQPPKAPIHHIPDQIIDFQDQVNLPDDSGFGTMGVLCILPVNRTVRDIRYF